MAINHHTTVYVDEILQILAQSLTTVNQHKSLTSGNQVLKKLFVLFTATFSEHFLIETIHNVEDTLKQQDSG